MKNFNNLENYLEDLVCPCCGNVGVVSHGGDSYICPICDSEADIYDEVESIEELLEHRVCPKCGATESLELIRTNGDYLCYECNYSSNVLDEIDAENNQMEEYQSMFNEKQNSREDLHYEEEKTMEMFELDNDLEKEYECPICGYKVGCLEYGRYFVCPECEWDGDFNLVGAEEGEVTSNILKDKFCPECGEAHFLELLSAAENDEDDEGDYEGYDYVCHNCGHQGNFQDELDAQNYFWDEGLCGYNEDDKGEVFDWAS